jgi:hypothetical protein
MGRIKMAPFKIPLARLSFITSACKKEIGVPENAPVEKWGL